MRFGESIAERYPTLSIEEPVVKDSKNKIYNVLVCVKSLRNIIEVRQLITYLSLSYLMILCSHGVCESFKHC